MIKISGEELCWKERLLSGKNQTETKKPLQVIKSPRQVQRSFIDFRYHDRKENGWRVTTVIFRLLLLERKRQCHHESSTQLL